MGAQDLPFNKVILFAYAADTHLDLHTYACLQAHIIPTDLLGRPIFARLLFLMF